MNGGREGGSEGERERGGLLTTPPKPTICRSPNNPTGYPPTPQTEVQQRQHSVPAPDSRVYRAEPRRAVPGRRVVPQFSGHSAPPTALGRDVNTS